VTEEALETATNASFALESVARMVAAIGCRGTSIEVVNDELEALPFDDHIVVPEYTELLWFDPDTLA
jgi:hypothetical protein